MLQPPSGGCVLKRDISISCCRGHNPAAFRRLCVETQILPVYNGRGIQPPSGGCVLKPSRLSLRVLEIIQPPSGGCVLKPRPRLSLLCRLYPAAFRRLCVETKWTKKATSAPPPAAFRRLCVETGCPNNSLKKKGNQPPSGGCVLKPETAPCRNTARCQPPSGGCVLKQKGTVACRGFVFQPPSGGCVLKRVKQA